MRKSYEINTNGQQPEFHAVILINLQNNMPKRSKILIVDDAPAGRQTLETLLLSKNYQIHFAEDGTTALAKAGEIIPDLILLDVMMPDMDGFEVCRRLRVNSELAEVPIVMVTVLDNKESRIRGLEAGADDFITKPFDKEELRARVSTILRLNRYRMMQAERAKFDWAVENSEEGYLMINDSDQISYMNPQAKVYFNLTKDAFGSDNSNNHNSGCDNLKFKDMAAKFYICEPEKNWEQWPPASSESASISRYLVRQETTKSQALWLQVNYLESPAGVIAQHLIRLKDVTAELSNQRNIRTFQAMVSHKMRTPLATLIYSFEDINRVARKEASGELLGAIDRTKSELIKLKDEIDDIFQYVNSNKIATYGGGFKFSRLGKIIASLKSDFNINYISSNISSDVLELSTPLSEMSIKWILIEILENSVKFHPANRPNVEITGFLNHDDKVVLRIVDDGASIPMEQMEKVWSPYYQVEKHFTGQVPGMGLGLSVVESLMWEAGGKCNIYNRDGHTGIIVELVMPVER